MRDSRRHTSARSVVLAGLALVRAVASTQEALAQGKSARSVRHPDPLF
jgi:hypothetical protein